MLVTIKTFSKTWSLFTYTRIFSMLLWHKQNEIERSHEFRSSSSHPHYLHNISLKNSLQNVWMPTADSFIFISWYRNYTDKSNDFSFWVFFITYQINIKFSSSFMVESLYLSRFDSSWKPLVRVCIHSCEVFAIYFFSI